MNYFEEGNSNEPQIGMKPSKKFANGTIHENGSGRFKVLDRYLENNIIMIKYQWLTGENEGKVEVNKEVNVNASIWKFKKVRGLIGNSQEHEVRDETNTDHIIETINSRFDYFHTLEEQIHSLQKQIKGLNDSVTSLLELTKVNHEQIQTLVRNYDLTNKLIDKI
ncbi:hypothetical protein [Peribacillus acanthi]|uniref:hypothetical protein n=1 Tax=Peribacillus acanthi TaxID=2171554 RepID=UPI000D3E11FF|nr:hypothetical protein [Peribacillus acanthi]